MIHTSLLGNQIAKFLAQIRHPIDLLTSIMKNTFPFEYNLAY